MLNFSKYLTEAAGKGLSGNTGSVKTKGHIKRYIFPFLSSEQKKHSLLSLGDYFSKKDVEESDQQNHGSFHNPKENQTHFLASNHGEHKKGTAVRVTSVYNNNGTIMAKTQNHGDMPISKLGTPEQLAAKQQSKRGLELEPRLQANIDPTRQAAGSTKTAHDFSAGDTRNNGKAVRGKALKKFESEAPSLIRGESKTSQKDKVAMGTSELAYSPETRQWSITNPGVSEHFSKATVNGVPLLDHLNKNHPDGVISKGFSAKAAQGTTVGYLRNANVNTLHLHRYKEDKDGNLLSENGTTFTVGDNNPLNGKLGMSHLGESSLDRLDGSLRVEMSRPKKGGGFVSTVKHNPVSSVYREYANHSLENEGSIGVHEEHHGAAVRQKISELLDDADKRGIDHSVFTQNAFSSPNDSGKTSTSSQIKPPAESAPAPIYSAGTRVRQAAIRNPSNWTQNQPQRPLREISPIEQHATSTHGGSSAFYSGHEQKLIKGEV